MTYPTATDVDEIATAAHASGVLPWQIMDTHPDHTTYRTTVLGLAALPDPGASAWTRVIGTLLSRVAFEGMHPDRSTCADCTRPVRVGRRHGTGDRIEVDIWPHPRGEWLRLPGPRGVTYRRRGPSARGRYREHILTCESILVQTWQTGS